MKYIIDRATFRFMLASCSLCGFSVGFAVGAWVVTH